MNDQLNFPAEEERFSWKKAWGFGFNYFGSILNMLFVSYLTYFATNSLFMAGSTIGLVLLFSKIFDGFTDIVAGIIIDKSHMKWGKARPFALFGILAWISTVLMFMVPGLSDIGKAIYIFIFYNLNQSIFYTLSNVAKTTHIKRSIRSEKNRIKTLTLSGMVYSVGNLALNVVFPILVDLITGDQMGWIAMATVLAALSIVGILLCFFWCPEYTEELSETSEKKEKIPFRRLLTVLFTNKYIFMYAAMQFVTSIIAALSIGAGTYYFTYIVGDLKLFAIVSAVGVIAYPLLPFIPKITNKIGKQKLLLLGFTMGSIGAVIRLIGYDDLIFLAVGNLISSFGLMPTNFVGPEAVIDCMIYSEKKTGVKLEAIFSSIENFALKVAAGIGAGLLGILLDYFGFNALETVQTAKAIGGIGFLYNWIPIILYGCLVIITPFFDVEKRIKTMKDRR